MTQTYARVVDGAVVEIWLSPGEDVTPVKAFHPDYPGHWHACGVDVEPGFQFTDGAFNPPVAEPKSMGELLAHAADLRWRKEVGGVLVGDVPVATDDRSKLMITGARVAAMADPDWSTEWHGADGATYPVDAVAMVAISDAVQAHVNDVFATFAAVKAAIEAGTITTTAEIDAAFAG